MDALRSEVVSAWTLPTGLSAVTAHSVHASNLFLHTTPLTPQTPFCPGLQTADTSLHRDTPSNPVCNFSPTLCVTATATFVYLRTVELRSFLDGSADRAREHCSDAGQVID
jgi:hypothetical protein